MNPQIDVTVRPTCSSSQRSMRVALVAGLTVCALVFVGAVSAQASSDADPDAVAEAVADVAPTELEALPVEQSGDQLTASLDGGGEVATGVDPADGLTFSSADGSQTTSVALPDGAELSDASVNEDGSITFAGDRSAPSVNVLTSEDAVRVATVIASAEQTEEFAYDFGAQATVEIREDGSALVVTPGPDDTELIIADIDMPWATDADGAAVPTHYVAEGGILTQVVNHRAEGVTYPVVADPKFDQPNVFQYRVRFNRAETKTIAQNGLAALGGAACGSPMALACIVAAGAVGYNAGIAENSNPKRCVQITATNTFSPANIIWWVDTYRGGPCK